VAWADEGKDVAQSCTKRRSLTSWEAYSEVTGAGVVWMISSVFAYCNNRFLVKIAYYDNLFCEYFGYFNKRLYLRNLFSITKDTDGAIV